MQHNDRGVKRGRDHDGIIPDELLMRVFRHLGPIEVGRTAAPVCRRWATVAHDRELWRRFAAARVHTGRLANPANNSWRSLVIGELRRSSAEDEDLKHRIGRIQARARRRQGEAVLAEFMRRTMRAAKLDLDAMFARMLAEWPCSDYVPHRDRIRLVLMAVSNGSRRVLPIVHAWHVARSLAEGTPVCAMGRCDGTHKHRSQNPTQDPTREIDDSDEDENDDDDDDDALPTISPSLYLAISRGNMGVINELHRLHATCCSPRRHGSRLVNLLLALVSRSDDTKNADILRLITSRWARADIVYDERRWHTVLFRAIECNPCHIPRLVSAGCDIEWRDAAGFTPLHYALLIGKMGSVEALINCGADATALVLDGTHRRMVDLVPDGCVMMRARLEKVWFDLGRGASPPPKYQKWQNEMLAANPGWTLRQWDRAKSDAFVMSQFPWFYLMFADFADDIYRIDAIWYLALYYFGGIYIDMDVSMVEKLDAIVAKDPRAAVLTRSCLWSRSISNYFMVSPRFHPLMRIAIKNLASRGTCMPLNARDSFLGAMTIAGPHFLSDVYHDYLEQCKKAGVKPAVWVAGPHAFSAKPPAGMWQLGVHDFDSGWGSMAKARGDIAQVICFLGIFVVIVVVYHSAGWPWALAVVALLGGALALGVDSSLQSCHKTPRPIAAAELDKLQNSNGK